MSIPRNLNHLAILAKVNLFLAKMARLALLKGHKMCYYRITQTCEVFAMLNICICDDDATFVWHLQDNVKQFFAEKTDIKLITYSDALLFSKDFPSSDLYILDIKMPEISGFELAARIRDRDTQCSIIFISSLSEAVYDSFPFAPLWYIRKEALEKELVPALSAFWENRRKSTRKIQISYKGKLISLSVSSIRFCESNGHYVTFHCLQENYRVRGKIAEYLPLLSGYDFGQPCKSFLVNLHYVSVFSGQQLTLDNGEKIPVTKGYRNEIKNSFLRYQRSFHHDYIS